MSVYDRLDAVGRKEHPNVDHYRSGGMGHRDGDESRSVVGFVPTRMLFGYEGNKISNPDTIRQVHDDIKSGKGITNPLMMQYDHKNNWAKLGEGNHRLEGATRAAARTVPVRFIRSDLSRDKENGVGGPMHMHRSFGHEEGYVPSDIHPYHFIKDENETHQKMAGWLQDAYGDQARPFGGDPRWLKDGGAPHPKYDFAKGEKPEVHEIPFDHPLVSGQADVNYNHVQKIREGEKARASGNPDVLAHPNGDWQVMDGHHRLLADRMDGKSTKVNVWKPEQMHPQAQKEYDWLFKDIVKGRQASLRPLEKVAMPWFDDGTVNKPRPRSVRRAGFAGFVADHEWMRDHVDGRYANPEASKPGHPDNPDHLDSHLAHFTRSHSGSPHTWGYSEGVQNVDMSGGVHATQSHVAQFHVDRYKKKPDDTVWSLHGEHPDVVAQEEDSYPGAKHPLFVTHQGRLHAIEGHHRVAAALQAGETHMKGFHYDLDKNPVVDGCRHCRQHVWDAEDASQSQAQGRTGSLVSQGAPTGTQAVTRAHRAFGKGLNALFPDDGDGPAPSVTTPWPSASESKDRKTFDEDLVARSITHPHEFPTEELDPRELRARQPKLLRQHVKSYMDGTRDQDAQDSRLGNDVPRVYHRTDDDQKIILSGHHRAAAALLKGEPFHAKIIRGGWGPARTK